MKRREGESSEEFFRRVTQAAADPHTFRAMALSNTNTKEPSAKEVTDAVASSSSKSPIPTEVKQQTPKYQRIEEWDAKTKKESLEQDQKLQFDGQRNGNRFQQNEILRRHIGSFF